jgi:hypothetical protein
VIERKVSRLIVLSAATIGAVLIASSLNHRGLLPAASKRASAAEAPPTVPMAVERLDPGLDAIVPTQPVLQKAATGPGF